MILVDTNVLVDVLEDDPRWAQWSIRNLQYLAKLHDLAINPIIYAELSLAFTAVEELDKTIVDLELRVLDIPRPALFLAGKAFVRYRRRGGIKDSVLPDFFIGAQAAVMALPILTRDVRRYRSYFNSVELIAPTV